MSLLPRVWYLMSTSSLNHSQHRWPELVRYGPRRLHEVPYAKKIGQHPVRPFRIQSRCFAGSYGDLTRRGECEIRCTRWQLCSFCSAPATPRIAPKATSTAWATPYLSVRRSSTKVPKRSWEE